MKTRQQQLSEHFARRQRPRRWTSVSARIGYSWVPLSNRISSPRAWTRSHMSRKQSGRAMNRERAVVEQFSLWLICECFQKEISRRYKSSQQLLLGQKKKMCLEFQCWIAYFRGFGDGWHFGGGRWWHFEIQAVWVCLNKLHLKLTSF